MRIAIVTETFLPSTDGVVTRLTYAVEYMNEQGHEVAVICPDIEGVPTEYAGAKIFPMPAKTFFFYKQRPWALPTSKVAKIFTEFQPNIVHVFNPVSLGASAVHYAKKFYIPLICSYHTNVPDYLDSYGASFLKPIVWEYLKRLHNSAPINMTTSNSMKAMLESKGINNVRVLPIGLDLKTRSPKFKNDEMRNRLSGGEPEKKLLIFVGRLAAEKDIQSLYPLIKDRDDLRLAIVGGGPLKEELEEKFSGTPTVFTGFLHGEELSQAYASADVFVFPSTSETLGLVITEAMASGLPVVAAASPPILDQIKNGVNGLIYSKETAAPFTLKLEECLNMLDEPSLKNSIIRNGLKYAAQFSWDDVTQSMLNAYIETLQMVSTNVKITK